MAPIDDLDQDGEFSDTRRDLELTGVVPLALHVGTPLGQGASGEVSPLLFAIDGGRYAIREVKRRSGADAAEEAAMLHEVHLHRLCSAECNAVLRYAFSYFTTEAMLVVMEACDCDLWDAIIGEENAWKRLDPTAEPVHGPRLFPEERVSIMRELASALRHCHGLRVLHRDLNPWNCFLSRTLGPQGSPRRLYARLGDFSMAAQLPPGVETLKGIHFDGAVPLDEAALGSMYSAPELGHNYGFTADVFSLGMVLLALWLSGEEAGRHREVVSAMVDIVKMSSYHEDMPRDNLLEELEPTRPCLRALLVRMLSIGPGDRPYMEEVYSTMLRGEAREEPRTSPSPPARRSRCGFFCRRREASPEGPAG
mmetsp:Transcript_49384/g.152303  ORF Transcript_49384/g.152303 Transcript_49384/m.152303 type:complete len:366 (-) Transcript_49384:10-1107(-)